MTKVMATGVFDILHLGHIYFLTEAKKLGDELVVVVARDSTAERLKRKPIMDENIRLKIVSSLKVVDEARLGNKDDIFKTVEEIKPNIIALGYDQKFDEKKIEKECLRRGLKVKVVRIGKYVGGDLSATRKIISKIVSTYGR
ncbi:MAG: adenylyltransferase/cytidyltransferase family protein [Candidatus Micrarchaeaceae archaeon]